jgi:MFS family permease
MRPPADAPRVSETGFGRGQKLVVALAGVTRAASGGMLGTALAVYVGRAGSPFAVGLLSTGFFAGLMVFAPLWGALGDLTGRRKQLLVVVSVATTALAGGFLLVVGSVPGLVGMRAAYATFAVGFGPLMLSIVGALAGHERRGRSAGFFSSSVAAGDMGGQALVGVLLGLLAPSELFLVVAAFGLVATAVAAFVADPDARGGAPASDDLLPAGLFERVRRRLLPTPGERAELRRTGLTTLYGALALRHAAVKGVGALVPIYLLAAVRVSETTMGLLLTVSPAAQILLMTLFGRVADVGSRKRLVLLGLAVSGGFGVFMAGASLVDGPARLVAAGAAFLSVAVGFSAMDIGVIALVGDAVPASREAAFIGLRSTAAGVGGVVGPLAVGALASVVGFAPAFAVSGLFAVLAAVLVWRTLVEPDRQSPAAAGLQSVETATGIARPPGAHRGSETPDED